MAERKESWVEDYLVQRVQETGGEIRKVGWIGRQHAPDRFAWWPIDREWMRRHRAHPRGVFVELKRPGLKDAARAGQKRERDRLLQGGFDACIIDTREDVDRLIAHYTLKEKTNG